MRLPSSSPILFPASMRTFERQVEEMLACWQALVPCAQPLGPYCDPEALTASATSACQQALASAQLPGHAADPVSASAAVGSLLALGVEASAAIMPAATQAAASDAGQRAGLQLQLFVHSLQVGS